MNARWRKTLRPSASIKKDTRKNFLLFCQQVERVQHAWTESPLTTQYLHHKHSAIRRPSVRERRLASANGKSIILLLKFFQNFHHYGLFSNIFPSSCEHDPAHIQIRTTHGQQQMLYSDSRANNAEAFFRNILTRDEERARRKLLIYFVAKSGADEIKQQFMLGLSADIMPALPFNFHAHTQNLLMAKLLSSYGSSSPSLTLSRWSWDVALRDHGISKLRIFVIMLGWKLSMSCWIWKRPLCRYLSLLNDTSARELQTSLCQSDRCETVLLHFGVDWWTDGIFLKVVKAFITEKEPGQNSKSRTYYHWSKQVFRSNERNTREKYWSSLRDTLDTVFW